MKNTLAIAFVVSVLLLINFGSDTITDTILLKGNESLQITEAEYEQEFMAFVAEHSKSYANSFEFNQRYEVFKTNYHHIVSHNLKSRNTGSLLESISLLT
jgi:phospholipid N-methyltransferase